ncbi:hypothetical protein Tco_0020754 [Tanacetum coccineum]
MEDGIFFNQSKYIKEMLKKFGLEDSKPTKTPMSTEIKHTKDDEADFLDSSKYQGMIGSLLYLTTSRLDIMFSVCLCAHFQENPKTTYLEAVKRILEKTVLAISTTKAEYVSAGKSCQQALWMKQALIDYGIRLDNVPNIEIRHHFLHDNVQKGNISIEKVASEDNIADIFTKSLKREVFNYLRLGLGLMELIMDSDPSSSQK